MSLIVMVVVVMVIVCGHRCLWQSLSKHWKIIRNGLDLFESDVFELLASLHLCVLDMIQLLCCRMHRGDISCA